MLGLLKRLFGNKEEETGNMIVIAGLGNPEKKYFGTRHNIGFDVIDALSDKYNIGLTETKFKAVYGKGRIGDQKVILVKPITYMNLSGEAIRPICDYFKVDTKEELIVISDDVELDEGNIRVRPKGSAGGHNGLKNIIAQLGHDEFSRVRVGVGKKPKEYDMVNWVLGHFEGEAAVLIKEGKERAVAAIEEIIENGVDSAMNKYNGKK
ncbi:aminoacyl-tRNA hydrolase [Butyrivibrio sp. INlla21]|uniref:aminoacyl-tRNA hydrolase n=1 Tax=Butyrivibrio sp. INlla21 TaxID=1520811 RepID=UPI0008E601F1|nr:aminoacyl-tRNA hydrolase [Butyrivibrio sp. INlla21]SFU84940.1 peptidyl-tRNA hydrolase, PTH1 family [Butyrivibrio sp. INlla21]